MLRKLSVLLPIVVIIALTRAPEANAELFRIALSTRDFGYLPLYVGMRTGLFAQENLEIQWIQVGSSVVVTALLAGEIDAAGIAGSAMRAARSSRQSCFLTAGRSSCSWARLESSACKI